jgi:hypothetical protein
MRLHTPFPAKIPSEGKSEGEREGVGEALTQSPWWEVGPAHLPCHFGLLFVATALCSLFLRKDKSAPPNNVLSPSISPLEK